MRRSGWVLLTAMFVLAVAVTPLLMIQTVSAAQITLRSLTLQAGATDGGSKAGGVVNHLFTFTLPNTTGGNVGSIKFLYCTTAAGGCTTPTGLVTTSATMGTQTGATGFTLNTATNGAPYVTRTAASVTAGTAVTYQLLSVTNPTANNSSFYVRITSYTGTDGATGPVDNGTVAASTAEPIVLSGVMPESLIFCTGATVTLNCASSTSGVISFDRLFSPTDTAVALSQMAASTNAERGYSITVNGATLTSGSNTITAMAAQALGTKGNSEFGMNLRANTTTTSTPAFGTELSPASNGTALKGQANTGYHTIDQFKFVSGDSVANSSSTGTLGTVGAAPGPTNSQVYTASYIVNVSGIQPPGTYTTTLTYICTALF
jgi:hypothetical protein